MNPFCVRANSATQLLRRVMESLVEPGPWEASSPRGMPIREHRHAWYRLEDTSRCAAYLPGRKLNYAFMVAEFLWIFCGRDDLQMIGTYCKEIHKFSDDGKTFFGAYGPRWRGQIEDVVENLKRDPDSRQGVVSIWRPEALWAGVYEATELVTEESRPSKDVPCTLSMQYLLRNGRLEAGVVMRSSDAWLGLPYDLFNFSMLQRAVAAELGVPAGSLTMYLGSSHLYERNLERAKKIIEAEEEHYKAYGVDARHSPSIQGVPGIDCEEVKLLETLLRGGMMEPPEHLRAGCQRWGHLLSTLSAHIHSDPSMLEEPWDFLEESPL